MGSPSTLLSSEARQELLDRIYRRLFFGVVDSPRDGRGDEAATTADEEAAEVAA